MVFRIFVMAFVLAAFPLISWIFLILAPLFILASIFVGLAVLIASSKKLISLLSKENPRGQTQESFHEVIPLRRAV